MEGLTKKELRRAVEIMCMVARRDQDALSQLDANVGDGDFGSSLALGFEQVENTLAELGEDAAMDQLLKSCGLAIIDHCGGCTGPLWGGAFRAAAKSVKGKESLALGDVAQLMRAAVDSVQKQGGAQLGDKTLLDAAIPAADSLEESARAGEALEPAMKKAAAAARKSADATADIIAMKGRARTLGKRSLGFPDPGAVAVATMLEEIADGLLT